MFGYALGAPEETDILTDDPILGISELSNEMLVDEVRVISKKVKGYGSSIPTKDIPYIRALLSEMSSRLLDRNSFWYTLKIEVDGAHSLSRGELEEAAESQKITLLPRHMKMVKPLLEEARKKERNDAILKYSVIGGVGLVLVLFLVKKK